MDTFQAKIGWNSPRNRENKNYRSVPFEPDSQQKIPKKIEKKFKKLKNAIMDSFQAKIGWNSLRNRENNNYRSVPFRSKPTSNRNSKKIAKKLKKK